MSVTCNKGVLAQSERPLSLGTYIIRLFVKRNATLFGQLNSHEMHVVDMKCVLLLLLLASKYGMVVGRRERQAEPFTDVFLSCFCLNAFAAYVA